VSVPPPCHACGRHVFPMGDKVGGELCLEQDIAGVAEAIRLAIADLADPEARDALRNILDIATRHQKTPVGGVS
jgi:hypothetical protein